MKISADFINLSPENNLRRWCAAAASRSSDPGGEVLPFDVVRSVKVPKNSMAGTRGGWQDVEGNPLRPKQRTPRIIGAVTEFCTSAVPRRSQKPRPTSKSIRVEQDHPPARTKAAGGRRTPPDVPSALSHCGGDGHRTSSMLATRRSPGTANR
jgi:hypothetical protein